MHASSALFVVALATTAAAQGGSTPSLQLIGGRGDPVAALEAGDTLAVAIDGLAPKSAYDLVLLDDTGVELGFARGAADLTGRLGPEVLWWESGVTGPNPDGRGNGGGGFLDFATAEQFLAAHALKVEVRLADPLSFGTGRKVAEWGVPVVAPRATPLFWFSDGNSNYRTSFEVGREEIYVSGQGLPAGALVDLWIVPDQAEWAVGAPIEDVSGFQGRPFKERVQLAPGSTGFELPVWPAVFQRPGSFDLIVRVNDPNASHSTQLRASDLVAHGWESGLVIERAPPAVTAAGINDLEVSLSGRRTTSNRFPNFRRQNVFVRHNTVAINLDPSDVPAGHPKPKIAAIYVTPARSEAQWTAHPALLDVTEAVELRNVKPGTVALGIVNAWIDPDPAGDGVPFDVVLDFRNSLNTNPPGSGTPGSPPPPGSLARLIYNGEYDVGVDAIDALDDDGLTIISDPAVTGPYPVGRSDYDFVDAYDIPWGQYQDQNVDVRAVVAYPAATAGVNTPVFGTNQRFPVIVILHGNHSVCMNFGCTCGAGNRIPNHKGYDYLLDLWASHGFIAISVDGYDITGCPTDRFIERGALMLEHLRYWTDWDNPTVPDTTFSGRFWNRLDLRHVGFAGHSRGGEGVAAAVQLNQDLALGYDIKAAVLIAPTDYNWSTPPGGGPIVFVLEDTPTFNIMGSSDGDVIDNDGAQLFDRASPAGRKADKSQAYIYGADHNSWNTVWIDPAWNGGSDGVGGGRITAQQQQDTGRVFITSWWMAWLQGRTDMLAFHRDVVQSPLLSAVETHWSYESKESVDVDDFEQTPVDKFTNSLGGAASASPTPATFLESGFRPGNYDGSFRQDTSGLVLGWSAATTYTSAIPAAWQDVSAYSHVAFRVAQIWDNKTLNPGGSQYVKVQIEDAAGNQQSASVDTRAFSTIPVGYSHPFTGRKSMLKSVRIPLRSFTQDNSLVDLTQITKIIVSCESTGLLAFDDLQFTK